MKAIYGSKLFKTSSRKAEIMAAIKNPVNLELIQQLRTYLDKEYQKPEYLDRDFEQEKAAEEAAKEPQVIFDDNPSQSQGGGHSFTPPAGGSSSISDEEMNDLADEVEDEAAQAEGDLGEEDETNNPDFDENVSDSEGEVVQESVQIKASECLASTLDLDSIKGTLNSREECTGVSRVSIKNCDELWIYYNDNTNLNTVMEPVIALLENAGYTTLAFNRLARTDNAIVFEVVNYV